MKIIIIAPLIFLFAFSGYSQNENPNKISFSSINQVGAVKGAQRDAVIVQTINGINFQNWSIGIGVGMDGYSERSIPLFIDVRKSFTKGDSKPFAYVDGGINYGWPNFIQREELSFPDYTQPSWYYDAGVGWNILLGKKTAFVISAGYSLKQLSGYRTINGPGIPGQINEYREEFENTYRRVSIKLGVHL